MSSCPERCEMAAVMHVHLQWPSHVSSPLCIYQGKVFLTAQLSNATSLTGNVNTDKVFYSRLHTTDRYRSNEALKHLNSCWTDTMLASFISSAGHLQLSHAEVLSVSDCSQPSLVSGTLLPPIVCLRYCNAASVLVGYSAVQSHSMCLWQRRGFNHTANSAASRPVHQCTGRLYVNWTVTKI